MRTFRGRCGVRLREDDHARHHARRSLTVRVAAARGQELRASLLCRLAEGTVQWGRRLEGYDEDDDGVRLRFAGGSTVRAQLLCALPSAPLGSCRGDAFLSSAC
jgi:hypothetical protein